MFPREVNTNMNNGINEKVDALVSVVDSQSRALEDLHRRLLEFTRTVNARGDAPAMPQAVMPQAELVAKIAASGPLDPKGFEQICVLLSGPEKAGELAVTERVLDRLERVIPLMAAAMRAASAPSAEEIALRALEAKVREAELNLRLRNAEQALMLDGRRRG